MKNNDFSKIIILILLNSFVSTQEIKQIVSNPLPNHQFPEIQSIDFPEIQSNDLPPIQTQSSDTNIILSKANKVIQSIDIPVPSAKKIIEQMSNTTSNIKIPVPNMEKVAKKVNKEFSIPKPQIPNKIDPKYWNKRHSIGIGFGTNKTFNIIQYTYDLKLSKSVSLYGLIGFGNLFGLGVAWQQNYNDNGLMLGWSGGIDVEGASFGSLALSYQWRLGQNHTFFSLGLASYAYEYESYSDYGGWEDEGAMSETELIQMFVPVLSIDRRFGF